MGRRNSTDVSCPTIGASCITVQSFIPYPYSIPRSGETRATDWADFVAVQGCAAISLGRTMGVVITDIFFHVLLHAML